MTRSIPRLAAGTLVVLVLATSGTQQAAADIPEGTDRVFAASNGSSLRYHRFEGGDRGVLFFFDGDGSTSWNHPEYGKIRALREAAAAEGFDLVFVKHPQGGRSWWNGVDTVAARDAVKDLIDTVDAPAVELMGYSGGAEFLARHLLVNGTEWLPSDSAATMVGGGGLAGRRPAPPSPGHAAMDLTWVTGDGDGLGNAEPGWSALKVSREAVEGYRAAGYRDSTLEVVPNTDHVSYAFGSITTEALADAARSVRAPAPAPSPQARTGRSGSPSARAGSRPVTAPPTGKASSPVAPASAQRPTPGAAAPRPAPASAQRPHAASIAQRTALPSRGRSSDRGGIPAPSVRPAGGSSTVAQPPSTPRADDATPAPARPPASPNRAPSAGEAAPSSLAPVPAEQPTPRQAYLIAERSPERSDGLVPVGVAAVIATLTAAVGAGRWWRARRAVTVPRRVIHASSGPATTDAGQRPRRLIAPDPQRGLDGRRFEIEG